MLGSCGARVALTSESCLKGLPRIGNQSTNLSTNTNTSATNTSSPFINGQTTTSSGGINNFQHHHSNSSFPSSTTGSGGSGIGSSGGGNYYNHYTSSTNPNDVADFKVYFYTLIFVLKHIFCFVLKN